MSNKMKTKLRLAHELERMLQTVPIQKIRVTTLSTNCGMSPSTFYIHFRDKYELVAWVFLYDFCSASRITKMGVTEECISSFMSKLEERREFYLRAYSERSQSTINQYLFQFYMRYAEDAIKRLYNKPPSSEQVLIIKYHFYGMIGLFKEWIKGSSLSSIEELMAFQCGNIPRLIKEMHIKSPIQPATYLV